MHGTGNKTTGHIFGLGHIVYTFNKCHFLTYSVFKASFHYIVQTQDTWLKLNMEHRTFIGEVENCLFIVVSDLGLGQEQIFFKVLWYIDPCDICVFISDTEDKGNKKHFQTDSTLSLN